MKALVNLLFAISLIILLPVPGNACTTFVLKDSKGQVVFGRNFDFPVGYGHIHINKKNQQKTAFVPPPEKQFSWVSKYGSVTFNQGGREFPYGGMNEAGLVVELMWLEDAAYPQVDERHGLMELQWIQYQLDNCGTVEEVISSNEKLRISITSVAPLHFLVADATGDVATVEYLEGEMVVHRGADIEYPVLANCIYETSLDYKRNKETGSEREYNGYTANSSGRFMKAAEMVEAYDEAEHGLAEYAFITLDSVAQHPGTQWSIVYNISDREIQFKTASNPLIRSIDLGGLDFSCTAENLYADMDEFTGDPGDFLKITVEENLEVMNKVFDNVEFLKENVGEEHRKTSAEYFRSVECKKR